MSNLIVDSNEVIKPAFDKFWDVPGTRREMQKAFTKLGQNDAELMAMVDTNCLVVNFICEKLNITRGEIEVWVEKKKAELAELSRQAENA